MKRPFLMFCLTAAVLFSGCGGRQASPPTSGADETAELRGVWVSYLDINPLLQGIDPSTTAARLDTMLDTCLDKGMNTVFFHVRAHSDAYYMSDLFEPADSVTYLLKCGFDPLDYAVRGAHERGLALHAWINPYRIGDTKENAALSDADALFEKNGVWYYNPAHAAARQLVLDGVREILERYEVDGIHFDDYFYPAGMDKQAEPFEAVPDGMDVGDWRRTQVDALISGAYGLAHCHARLFGVSPTALTDSCRNTAYADVATWMRQAGYVDYICPQIYFGFDNTNHPFAETLAMWESLPRHDEVALYIGLALYKSGISDDPYAGDGRAEWSTRQDIIARQLQALREGGAADGFVLFRYAHLSAAQQEMENLQALL